MTTDISVLKNQLVPKRVAEIRRELKDSERSQAVTEIIRREPAHQKARSVRVSLGLTQSELATQAGVNKETVNRYELGENIRRDTEYKIWDAITRLNDGQGNRAGNIKLQAEPELTDEQIAAQAMTAAWLMIPDKDVRDQLRLMIETVAASATKREGDEAPARESGAASHQATGRRRKK